MPDRTNGHEPELLTITEAAELLRAPAATLRYDYASRVATVDHLAPSHPMQYDLCAEHTERLSVPNGWTLVDRRLGRVVDLHGRVAS